MFASKYDYACDLGDTATLTQEALGTQTVIAAISDAAGKVGVATNQFVLTAYTTGSYSSDTAGCVTQIVYQGPVCQQTSTLTWDGQYRLSSVATNGATAESYTFDPAGRRISTTANDGTVTRYLNNGGHVIADLNSTGGVIRTYMYGPNVDELLAITVFTNATPQTYYTIRDHQNTVWALVDTNGATVESYDFDAWGRVLSAKDGNGNLLTSSAIGNRYLFQGREYSWATGLYYFRARFYDPVVSRWLSPDPIGINGGLNQYMAFGNNPVNFVDPTGLWGIQVGSFNFGRGTADMIFNRDAADAFAEGFSRSGQGIVNAFTGGLFNPKNGLFYDKFNQQWKDLGKKGNDCDSDAFNTGMTGGRIAEGALLAAGVVEVGPGIVRVVQTQKGAWALAAVMKLWNFVKISGELLPEKGASGYPYWC